jgi:hypothetical protein
MQLHKFMFRLLVCLLLSAQLSIAAQDENLSDQLASIEGVISVEKLGTFEDGSSSWKLFFSQPVDHSNPEGPGLKQRMFLIHRDFSAPMVMITDGYSVNRNVPYELTSNLQANQLYIEHRYFGQSKPENADWKYLTITQAAEDHHAIREAFGSRYQQQWISTGISKGGQTALFYKFFYPQDVSATVAYVAPIVLAREDERPWDFVENIGTEECRAAIRDFQNAVLSRRAEIIPLLENYQERFKQKFLYGPSVTLEFLVAEYPFSFWQMYKGFCSRIPGNEASANELYQHLLQVVPSYLYTEATFASLAPAFYQFVTEIGYYGFRVDHLSGLLLHEAQLDNANFAPQNTDLTYSNELMLKIEEFLRTRAQNVIYVYGELDTWSACALKPAASTNSFAVYIKDGAHSSRIGNLSEEDREGVYSRIKCWIGMK